MNNLRTILFLLLVLISFYLIQFFFPSPKIIQEQKKIEKQKFIEPKIPQTAPKLPVADKKEQTFYVIENDYQQLVFSSIGGCITEINLPFKSKTNQKSIINEIAFDKELKESSKANATFPLHNYFIFEKGKIVEKEGTLSGYYPLLRRQIIGSEEMMPSKLYSLNITNDFFEIENASYKLVRLEKNLIEFELNLPNLKIFKTYKFADNAPYTFEMIFSIEGDLSNLWLTSGVPDVELISGKYSPALKIKTTRKQKNVVDNLALPKIQTTVTTIYPDWICNSNGFFGIIIDPLSEMKAGYKTKLIPGQQFPTRLVLIDPEHNLYPADKYPGYETFLPIKPNQKTTIRIFAGPFSKDILTTVDDIYSDHLTGYNPSYISAQSFHGLLSFISEPFAKMMFILMQLFYKTTHSWGFSIILLTFALRVMLYPLNAWAIKSQMQMQELTPKIQAIQNRYAKNSQKAKMEIMKLYKEKGANPLMGCFPILIQLPFLIGMFDLLKSVFEFRGSSFIPGWIDSLTAPDVLFSWNFSIPLIGREFHLIPIIMGILMFLQSKFTTKKPETSQMTDQQRQQQAFSTILPIVLTVIFYKMPSGLNIYYLFFTIFGILQQWMMNKIKKKPKLT